MEGRPVTISITTGTLLKTALVIAGAWFILSLHNLILDIIAAVVIASAIEPGVARLRRAGLPRALSVILVYLSVFAVLFVVFFFFIPSVFEDLTAFIAALPQYLETFNQTSALDEYANILGVTPPEISSTSIMEGIREYVDAGGVLGNAFTAIASIFGGVFSFILILVFSFYFAVNETGVDDFLRVVSPRQHQAYVLDLWSRSRQKIGLWMQGQLLLAVIMGVLMYLGLTILGIKHALLLAVIAAIFEIIPVFGPTLAAIPAILIGFVDGGATKGFMTVGLYVIAQQFENHLIYPLVVTRVVGVPPLLVILALIVGAQLAGFLGILLSVPAAATIQEFVKDWEERKAFAGAGSS
jgi:predicted PurR-regulated permease PerM